MLEQAAGSFVGNILIVHVITDGAEIQRHGFHQFPETLNHQVMNIYALETGGDGCL